MKKSLVSTCLMIGLALSIAAGVGACKSVPTIQQQFLDLCPTVTADLKVIGGSPLLNTQQAAILNGIPGDPTHPGIIAVNTSVCAAGAQLNVTDLQTLHDTLLPAVVTIVQAVPAFPDQTAVLLGLNTFGPLVQGMIDQLIAAAALKTAPVSAPVAASS